MKGTSYRRQRADGENVEYCRRRNATTEHDRLSSFFAGPQSPSASKRAPIVLVKVVLFSPSSPSTLTRDRRSQHPDSPIVSLHLSSIYISPSIDIINGVCASSFHLTRLWTSAYYSPILYQGLSRSQGIISTSSKVPYLLTPLKVLALSNSVPLSSTRL